MSQLTRTRSLPLLLALLMLTAAPAYSAVQCGHLDTIQIAAGTYHEKISMVPPNGAYRLFPYPVRIEFHGPAAVRSSSRAHRLQPARRGLRNLRALG
jgi:hypothetical protein